MDSNSLDNGYSGSSYDSSLESNTSQTVIEPFSPLTPARHGVKYQFLHYRSFIVITFVILLIASGAAASAFLFASSPKGNKSDQTPAQKVANYAVTTVPVSNVTTNGELDLGQTDKLTINGEINVSSGLVLAPSSAPTTPVVGEIYFDKTTNKPYYYNGTSFVQFSSGAVVAVQGTQQNLTAGNGISINGNVISATNTSNGSIVSVTGTDQQINVINSDGTVSLSLPQDISMSSSPDFNNLTLDGDLGVNGVISGDGSGLTSLNASNVNSGILGIQYGGTGAATPAAARTNLQAAESGVNADITSLTDLSSITPSSALSIGATGEPLYLQGNASTTLSATNSGYTTTLSFTSPTQTANIAIPNTSGTVAVAAEGPLSLDSTGTLTCTNCLVSSQLNGGGGVLGVVSVNTFSGELTVNAGVGLQVTNNSGTITVAADQDISTTASPTFNNLSLNGGLSVTGSTALSSDLSVAGTETVTGQTNANGGIETNGTNIDTANGSITTGTGSTTTTDLTVNGTETLSNFSYGVLQTNSSGQILSSALDLAGGINYLTGLLPVTNGGTGAATPAAARTNLQAAESGVNADITSLTDLSSITPSSALSIGATGEPLYLQGNASTTLSATNSGYTTTLSFTSPTQTANIAIPNTSGTVAVAAEGPLSLDSTGTLTCTNCLVSSQLNGGGGVLGVVSVNTFSGELTVNAGVGLQVTNNSGTITVAADQDISTTASPTFNNLSLNGSLGINNTSPQYPIDVNGDINTSGQYLINGLPICTSGGCAVAGGSAYYIDNTTVLQTGAFNIQGASNENPVAIVRAASGQQVNTFEVENGSGTNELVVSDNGYVGIGKASPTYPLDVNGTINTNSSIDINGVAVCSSASGCTPAPGSNNYIENTSTLQSGASLAVQSSPDSTSPTALFEEASGQTGDLIDADNTSGTTLFSISSNGGGYISGDLGIGTTSPSYPLDVNGDVNISSVSDYLIGGTDICDSTGCIARGGSGSYIQNSTTLQNGDYAITSSASASSPTALIQQASGQTGDLIELQNSSASNVFTVSPGGAVYASSSLGVGVSNPTYAIDVAGDINITGDYRIDGQVICSSTGCLGGGSGGSGSYINNSTTTQAANFSITSDASSTLPTTVITQASGQTGDLLDLDNSSSSIVAGFSPSGQLKVGGATAFTSNLNIGTNTTTAAGGIYFGTDTDLYRSGNGTLKTDGSFDSSALQEQAADYTAGLTLQSNTSGSTKSTNLVFEDNESTPQSISLRKDGSNLVVLNNSGSIQLGFNPTTDAIEFGNSLDSSIYRSGTNQLTTPGQFIIQGQLTASGDELVGGPSSTNSTTEMVVQNASGTNVLEVDTAQDRVGIDTTGTPNYPLDVNGDINVASGSVYRIGGVVICQSSGCNPVSGSQYYIQNGTTLQSANFAIVSSSTNQAEPTAVIEQGTYQTGDLLDLDNNLAATVTGFNGLGQELIDGASGYDGALAIGTSSDTTAANGISFGGDTSLYRSAAGELSIQGPGSGVILSAGNATGSNAAGTNLALAGGEGTGTGSGGNINFNIYSPSGTSGSTNNTTASTVFSLSGTNGAATFENSTNSTSAFEVQNSSSNDVLSVNTTINSVGIDNANPAYPLDVIGTIDTSTQYDIGGNAICTSAGCTPASGSNYYIQNGTTQQSSSNFDISGNGTIGTNLSVGGTLGVTGSTDLSGTLTVSTLGAANTTSYLCYSASDVLSACSTTATGSAYVQGGNSFGTTAVLGTNDNYKVNLETDGHAVETLGTNGAATFENSTNSTSAFEVQNSSGASLLTADTTDGVLAVGLSSIPNSSGATLQVTGTESVSSLAASGNSVLCYNTTTDQLSSCGSSVGNGSYIYDSTTSQTANLNITSASASNPAAVFNATTGQTADITDFTNASNSIQTRITANGSVAANNYYISESANGGVINANTSNGTNVSSASAAAVVLSVQGAPSQSADLLDLDNSAGTPLVGFTSSGTLQGGNATGSNAAGTNLALAGGEGTGTGSGGNINFNIYSPSGTSGSTNNTTASTVFSLSGTNGAATFENSTNSTSAFEVQNSSSNDVLSVNTTINSVGIDNANPAYPLDVIGTIDTSTQYDIGGNAICTSAGCTPASGSNYYIQNGTTQQSSSNFDISGNGTIGTNLSVGGTLGVTGSTDLSGTLTVSTLGAANTTSYLCYSASDVLSACSTTATGSAYVQGGNSFGTTAVLGTNDNYKVNLETDGHAVETLGTNGAATFENSTNSTSAFEVQNSSGASLLTADTTDGVLAVGLSSIPNSSGATLQVTGTESVSSLAASGNSVLCYNTTTDQLSSCGSSVGNGSYIYDSTTSQTANLNITSASASNPAAVFNATTGQTADITDFTNASNSIQTRITANGSVAANNYYISESANGGVINANTSNGTNVSSASAAAVVLSVQGAPSQSADLLDLDNSAGTPLVGFTSSGTLQGGNATGSNAAGTNLALAGGEGTGTGSGGNINFNIYSPSGTSGSTNNTTASTVFSLSGTNGAATFENSTNSTSAFEVQNSSGASAFNIDTTTLTTSITGTANIQGGTSVFADTFASNNLALWSNNGMTTESGTVYPSDSYAAESNYSSGNPSYATAQLSSAASSGYYSFNVRLANYTNGNGNYLLDLEDSLGNPVATIYVANTHDTLCFTDNVHTAASACSTSNLNTNAWYSIGVSLNTGNDGSIEVYLNGQVVLSESNTEFGSNPIDYIQIGDNGTQTDPMVAYYDNISAENENSLDVTGTSTFNGNVSVSTDSSSAFGVANSSDDNVLSVNTLNNQVDVNGAQAIQGGLTISSLGTVNAPNVNNVGATGSTTYSYAVAAVTSDGGVTDPTNVGTTTTGDSALSSSNYNTISWTALPGASSYIVYRTVSGGTPASVGLVGTVLSTASSLSFNDTGKTATGTIPSTDTSSQLTASGNALFEDSTNSIQAFNVENSAGQSVLDVDTTNDYVGIGNKTPVNLLSIGALTTAVAGAQIAVSTGSTTNSGIVVQDVAGQSAGYAFQAQNSSGTALAYIDYAGNLSVVNATVTGNLTISGNLTFSGHYTVGGSTPTYTIGSAAGTASSGTCPGSSGCPSVTISGDDNLGSISITTGSSVSIAGQLVTVTFANAYPVGTTPYVIVSPANSIASQSYYYETAPTTNPNQSFQINVDALPAGNTTYIFNYFTGSHD